MKIFIISLKSSPDRRENITKQLAPLNLDWQFFDAVDGRDENFAFDTMQADLYRTIFRSRPLSPGEKGCYASHYLLWEECVKLNEPIVILEDDINITYFFQYVLKKLPALHLKYDYIKIEPSDSPCRKIESDGTFQIIQLTENSHATCGYSLTPLAAKKFLIKSNKWHSSVDNFIGEASCHKIISYSLIPYAVYPPEKFNKKGFQTTIQNTEDKRVPIYFKATRECNRFFRFIRLSLWNIFS